MIPQMLVLACDGVWDVCDNEEAGAILKAMAGEGETRMALIAEELLDQCLLRYSKDNISAVLVAFPAFFERHLREGEGVGGRRRRRQQQHEGGGGGGPKIGGDGDGGASK
jgi:serine/threonine protein phosphatase PrpC